MTAKADKDVEGETEIEAASADMKPGERKIISDGSDGPVVEIIRKGAKPETEIESKAAVDAEPETPPAEDTGE